MENLRNHRFITESRWSLHGNYQFGEGNPHSLEGHSTVSAKNGKINIKTTFWVLAEKPYKSYISIHADPTAITNNHLPCSAEHSDLGPVQGGFNAQHYELVFLFGSANIQGCEFLFRESENTYRSHGIIAVNFRKFAGWSAIYNLQK